jgi:hypothetical protein
VLTADGFTQGTIQTSADGSAVTISAYPLDYYFVVPNQLPSGAPDPSWVQFDFRDSTGEFAGFNYTYNWTDSNGTNWYYLYQEVNGEGHYASFNTDSAGNVNESSVVQAKATKVPDRCKIISDWGALQCPRDASPIREIPTQVRSFLTRIGWFDNLMSWTWDHVKRASDQFYSWLGDPKVMMVLITISAIAGEVGCCIGTATSACIACVIAGTAVTAAGASSYIQSTNGVPTITNTAGELRASGVIACSGAGCAIQVNCNLECPPSSGCFNVCGYPNPSGAPCPPSPWFELPGSGYCSAFLAYP